MAIVGASGVVGSRAAHHWHPRRCLAGDPLLARDDVGSLVSLGRRPAPLGHEILRPSLIDDEVARAEHRLGERLALPLSRALFSLVCATHRYAPLSADAIARALVHLAFDETSERGRASRGECSDP